MRDFMIIYISLRGISAVGSAPHWQCGGQGFESPMLHQKIPGLEPWYFFASQGFEPLTSGSKSSIWEKQSGGLFRSRLLRFVPFARKSVFEAGIRTPDKRLAFKPLVVLRSLSCGRSMEKMISVLYLL